MRSLIIIWGCLAVVGVCEGRTITVDDDGPADFNNIQAAIDDSDDGDTVLVADGTYTGDGNRDIDFHGKAITVKSANGPENCIIDCNGSEAEPHRGFYFHRGEDPSSILSDLTITSGFATNGGGIYFLSASPTIRNCIIVNNHSLDAGGGIHCGGYAIGPRITGSSVICNSAAIGGAVFWDCTRGDFFDVQLFNCLVAGNSATRGGGFATGTHTPAFGAQNCTLVNNHATKGGGLYCAVGWITLRNNILWGNTAASGPQIMVHNDGSMPPFADIFIYYCDLEGGMKDVHNEGHGFFVHEGDIDSDPYFAYPNNEDYHLKSEAGRWDPNIESWVTDDVTSPCIDAGDTMSPIGLEPFPNGGIVNMGAYGGTSEASKSYYGKPPCEIIVAGDVNGDCIVDFRDFQLMGLHWMEGNN